MPGSAGLAGLAGMRPLRRANRRLRLSARPAFAPLWNGLRWEYPHETFTWRKDPDLPHTGLDRWIVRQAGQAQWDDGGLGRHLLLPAALPGRVVARGHLPPRQPDGAAGRYRQRAVPGR